MEPCGLLRAAVSAVRSVPGDDYESRSWRGGFPLMLSADHLLSSFTAAHCLGSSSQEQFIGKAVSCEGRVLCIVVRPLQLRHPCLLPQAREP